MKRLVRSACALAAGFLATSGAVLLGDRMSESAAIHLGRLNMSEYCRQRYGQESTAQPTAKSAFGWRCYRFPNGVYESVEIDVRVACELLYGAPARAVMGSADDPYGWECLRD
jgi:hypothetical protein